MKKIMLVLLSMVTFSNAIYVGEIYVRNGLTIKVIEVHMTYINGVEKYFTNVKTKTIEIEYYKRHRYRYTTPFRYQI